MSTVCALPERLTQDERFQNIVSLFLVNAIFNLMRIIRLQPAFGTQPVQIMCTNVFKNAILIFSLEFTTLSCQLVWTQLSLTQCYLISSRV